MRFAVPLLVFLAVAGFLYVGLGLNPKEVPSPLIGKPMPAFSLSRLDAPEQTISDETIRGRVALVNVWASWCAACRDEHALLVRLAESGVVPIYGLNYKDTRQDGLRWLERLGNPYAVNAFDEKGRVGIDWGVYGVPETFVLDRQGIIRYKHIGPISEQDLEQRILPLIAELEAQP